MKSSRSARGRTWPRMLVLASLGASSALAQTTLPANASDAEARLGGFGDGGGTVANATAGTLVIGNANTGSASHVSPVYAFQLPSLGAVADPFQSATFSVALTQAYDWNGYNVDVYGLGARSGAAVLASDAFAGGGPDATDAVRIRDNWINLNASGIPGGVRTLSDAALTTYLNTKYASGAGAGKYVFLRLSPDAWANSWKDTRFAAAENATAANRPKIDYTLRALDYTRDITLAAPDEFFSQFRIIHKAFGAGKSFQSGSIFTLDGEKSQYSTPENYLFDLTPGNPSTASQSTFPVDPTKSVDFSFDARTNISGSSFGVMFINPHALERNIYALFVLKTGADEIGFFKNWEGPYVGEEIGSRVTVATNAEPGTALTRVGVTLTISGGAATLTVNVPGASPVSRSFAAADMDWANTLVALRMIDNGRESTAVTTADVTKLQIKAAAAPAAPPPPPAPSLPVIPAGTPVAAGVNLLAVNPSFETSAVEFGYGGFSFSGWRGGNERYEYSGTVNAGSPGGGTRAYQIEAGGYLETAPANRPAITPNFLYEATFDLRTIAMVWPEERPGNTFQLDFYNEAGVRLKTYWGPDWRPWLQSDKLYPWTTYTVRGLAPADATRAAVRFESPSGSWPRQENRTVEVDNFRLVRLAETADRLAVRRAPRLLLPGTTAELRVHHASASNRVLRVDLINPSNASVANASYTVPAGRRLNALRVQLPSSLPNGNYTWRAQLLPVGGGSAAATLNTTGVFADSTVAASTAANGTDFDADHPNLVFMGRVEQANPKRRWLHWAGSEVRVRFSGTSLTLLGSNAGSSANFVAVVDGDEQGAFLVSINRRNDTASEAFTVVSGLPDGVHTVRLFKSDETDRRIRVDGFRVDAGRGLLRAEPLSSRRLEIYGDSVTSGASSRFNYWGYAFRLGRELDLDLHVISKGGSGVSASFNYQDILLNYWDKLSYPDIWDASKGLPWDFSWTPVGVINAIGHNDQYNNGQPEFPARYAQFIGDLRAVYGASMPILGMNTMISSPVWHFDRALAPLVATDPNLRWAHQFSPSAPVQNHPSTIGHGIMVFGDDRRFSLADHVEQILGWGLGGP